MHILLGILQPGQLPTSLVVTPRTKITLPFATAVWAIMEDANQELVMSMQPIFHRWCDRTRDPMRFTRVYHLPDLFLALVVEDQVGAATRAVLHSDPIHVAAGARFTVVGCNEAELLAWATLEDYGIGAPPIPRSINDAEN